MVLGRFRGDVNQWLRDHRDKAVTLGCIQGCVLDGQDIAKKDISNVNGEVESD
jgi:hypothetical protein